jgi:hypothetical protein
MATQALRNQLDRAREAAGFRGRGAWDKQIGAGFGRPGAQRRIREYPVSEQERMIARFQQRDQERRKPSVKRAWGNVRADGLAAVDELLPVELNTSAHSTNPARPRALRGGYDSRANTVRVQFRDGAVYEYYEVPGNVWRQLLRSKSTGKYIDRVLDTYPYTRIDPSTGAPQGSAAPIGMFSTGNPDFAGLFENPGGGLFGGRAFHADEETEFSGYEQDRPDEGWHVR